jgi:antitoxin PrlF
MSKTKLAEQLFVRPEGATMEEVIAATGDYQYRALKRLKSRGYRIKTRKEGRVTRYRAVPPAAETFEAAVTAGGKMTLPKELREKLGVRAGTKLRLVLGSDDQVVMTPADLSVQRLFGILGKPPRSATLEQMDEAVRRGAVERYLRSKR